MIDRDLPVTQDELHAYVDGEIPSDRRQAVEAWLAHHPEDAALVAEWRAHAETIRARYGEIASEAVPPRFSLVNLDRIMVARRPWRAVAASVLVAASIGGVGGWVAHGAAAAPPVLTRFEIFTHDAIDAHKLYIVEVRHPVEVSGDERDHLVQWLSKRLGSDVSAPDLQGSGLALVGGRLLPGPSGPSAFFMYEGASGERFTLYCAQSSAPETGMRYREADRFSSFYWVDRGLAYVLSGPSDRKRLWAITKEAYDQIDKGAPTKAGG